MRQTPARRRAISATSAVCWVVIAFAGPASVAPAQPPAAASAAEGPSSATLAALSRRGDLTLRDATLESALFTISELWGVNIVAGKVEGAVNGVFKDAPLKDILDSILQSNGYAYRPVGGSLIVNRVEALGQVNPFFVSETIPARSADIAEVVEAARLLSTPQGQIRPLPSAGAILVVDFPDRVAKIRELVAQIDSATRSFAGPGATSGAGPRALEVAYFRTHYVPALRAGTAIDVVLSEDGRVATVEGDDRLLVVDYPEHIRLVEAVLARLDRPRPQVNIRSLIYDISLSDMEKIGVNWNGITDGTIDQASGVATGRNSGLRFLSQSAPALGASDKGGAFTFFAFEGNFDIRAVAIALQEAEDSRLLADPNVTVMDNEAANIDSISEIPFQQLTQTTGGGNIGTTAFKEVGIKLAVTPKISRDGSIDMVLAPEFSRLAGFTPGDNQPIIDTRRAATRVRVGNGQTVMIAGLRQRSDVGNFNGVPLLKDVRFLGHLFRARDTQVTESELVVFVTPEIVGYGDPLGDRDQLAADTINCRLDRVPPAEGCPQCGGDGPCGCPSVAAANETIVPPGAMVAPAASVEGPSLAEPADASAPEPVAPPVPVEEITPIGGSDSAGGVRQPALAKTPSRRLPPTSGLPNYETIAAESVLPIEPAPPEWALRVDYESRFRATGGVYPGHQRLTERPAPTDEKAPPAADEDRPWYAPSRIWR